MDIIWKIVGVLAIGLGVWFLVHSTSGEDKSMDDIRAGDIFWFLFCVFDGILLILWSG